MLRSFQKRKKNHARALSVRARQVRHVSNMVTSRANVKVIIEEPVIR